MKIEVGDVVTTSCLTGGEPVEEEWTVTKIEDGRVKHRRPMIVAEADGQVMYYDKATLVEQVGSYPWGLRDNGLGVKIESVKAAVG